ncbi:MAG TPA: hypothetical protein VD835_16940, partial [Pyrinomonadaceae bacterium]|nr:hypothetical protein [Pyrinomonadaceae bacterium]
MQSKPATAPQARKQPVAPAAYRPQAKPETVQAKTSPATQQRKPQPAPPVYRPQSARQVLQTKKAAPAVAAHAGGAHAASRVTKGQPPSQPGHESSRAHTARGASMSPRRAGLVQARMQEDAMQTGMATLLINASSQRRVGSALESPATRPSGGGFGVVQRTEASVTGAKGKVWGSGSAALKNKNNHAEQQALGEAALEINKTLTAQGATDTLALTLTVDTQVCYKCCEWIDTNFVSWLKKIKVGAGKKQRDWAGNFSLTIAANGGTKVISGSASTVAGIG